MNLEPSLLLRDRRPPKAFFTASPLFGILVTDIERQVSASAARIVHPVLGMVAESGRMGGA